MLSTQTQASLDRALADSKKQADQAAYVAVRSTLVVEDRAWFMCARKKLAGQRGFECPDSRGIDDRGATMGEAATARAARVWQALENVELARQSDGAVTL